MRNFGGFSPFPRIVAKTAAYTLVDSDHGTLFTTQGATAAVTFTLPPTADLQVGWSASFFAAEDVGMTIASNGSSDDIAALDDVAADSVAFSTASEIIGGAATMVWDGVNWLTFMHHAGGHLQTVTVA